MIKLNQLVYDLVSKSYTAKEVLVNPRYIVLMEQKPQVAYASGTVKPEHTFIVMDGCEIYYDQLDVLESLDYIGTVIVKAGL